MAICKICKEEMLTADGCTISDISIEGKIYKRIKHGDAGDFGEGMESECRCHDCNAKIGHYHHWFCDVERCPKCGGQLISCECEDVFVMGK